MIDRFVTKDPLHRFIETLFLCLILFVAVGFPSTARAQARIFDAPIFDAGIFDKVFQRASDVVNAANPDKLDIAGQTRLLSGTAKNSAKNSAKNIVAFVQEKIRLDLYQGSLRGARGALLARSGNPLDQALLLSEMLASAGYETRLRWIELTPAKVDELLGVYAREAKPDRSYLLSPDDISRALDLDIETVSDLRKQGVKTQGEVALLAKRWTAVLETAVGGLNDATSEWDGLPQRLYKVDYRQNGQDWRQANPVAALDIALQGTLASFNSNNVPAAMTHQFRLNLVLLVTDETGTNTEKPLASISTPAPGLYMTPISLAIVPDAAGGFQSVSTIKTALKSDKMVFTIRSVHGVSPVTRFFDMTGEISDAPLSGEQALAETSTGGFGGLGGALGGIFNAEPAPDKLTTRLSDIIIEYGYVTPQGTSRQFRRSLAQAYGKDKLDRAVYWTADINVSSGPLPKQAIALSKLNRMLALEPVVMAAFSDSKATVSVNQSEDASSDVAQNVGAAQIGPPGSAVLDFVVFAQGIERLNDARIYQSAPAIVAFETLYSVDNERIIGHSLLDIVALNSAALGCDDRGCAPPGARARLDAGVLWTAVEREFLANLRDPARLRLPSSRRLAIANAGSDLDRALRKGDVRMSVIRDAGELQSVLAAMPSLDDTVIRRMRQDLNAGYELALVDDKTAAANWWRFDPGSGLILGTGSAGRGQATTETAVLEGGAAANTMTAARLAFQSQVSVAALVLCMADLAQSISGGANIGLIEVKVVLCVGGGIYGIASIGSAGTFLGAAADVAGAAIDAVEFYQEPNPLDAGSLGVGFVSIVF